MKRVRLTLPINWTYSLELRRLLDLVETLQSCQDLQIDLHQNSWIPDYYQYQFLVGPFGLSRSGVLLTELRDLMVSSVFDNVEVVRYLDSSLGPENLPATCRHQYDSAMLLQVENFERLLQWSHEDAHFVDEYVKAVMNDEPCPDSYSGQDQDTERRILADNYDLYPSALGCSMRRFKDDFRKQLMAYWKYLRAMPLKKQRRR
ncbi:hypothetical protein MMC15_006789 [Xylographa vitiligo]|nr:hypothetical protein [Xylographa vitiligo]